MNGHDRNITYIDPRILEAVEKRLRVVMNGSGMTCVLLVDRSGAVLTNAGDPWLHPDEMGAIAAGVFSAMRRLIKASRTDEFIVKIPNNNAFIQFYSLDNRLFLCAFYNEEKAEDTVLKELEQLASDARNAITMSETSDWHVDNFDFISDKLNELFK
jgi:hypothetical protein